MGALNVLSTPLLAGWAAWLLVGLLLILWARRAREAQGEALQPAYAAPRPQPKPPVHPKPAPATASHGDAFGELQALLDTPPQES
jgi:hypothetical protein